MNVSMLVGVLVHACVHAFVHLRAFFFYALFLNAQVHACTSTRIMHSRIVAHTPHLITFIQYT